MHDVTALIAELQSRTYDPTFADAPVIDVYARISVNRDTGETEKTDRQTLDILNALTRRHVRLGVIHCDDNWSAWHLSGRRPGWKALLARIDKAQTNGVAVWHTDRLMRQPRDLETLIDLGNNGLPVYTCFGDHDLGRDNDRFMLRVITAASCKESDSTSRRARRAMAQQRDRGVYHGGTRPFGQMGNGVSDATVRTERECIALAAEWLLQGRSFGEVAREWTRRGIRQRANGRAVTFKYVQAIMTRPSIAGILTHKGQRIGMRTDYDGAITPDTFDALQRQLASRPKAARRTPREKRPLAGILVCGECGAPMVGRTNGDRQQYTCSASVGCGRLSIAAGPVEEHVRAAVVARLRSPEFARGSETLRQRLDAAQARRAHAERALDNLAQQFAKSEITASQWGILQPRLLADLRAAEDEAAQIGDVATLVPDSPAVDPGDEWDNGNGDDRRQLCRRARIRVTVARAESPKTPPLERLSVAFD